MLPQPLLSSLHHPPRGPSLSLLLLLLFARGSGPTGVYVSRGVTSLFPEALAPKVAKVSFQGLHRSTGGEQG